MRYIAELTKMIAERCKPPGAYGLLPAAFAREVGKVVIEPDVEYTGELGEYQWWQELNTHQWYIEYRTSLAVMCGVVCAECGVLQTR